MTAKKSKDETQARNTFNVVRRESETNSEAIARHALGPMARHAATHAQVLHSQMGGLPNCPTVVDYAKAVEGIADNGAAGDLAFAGRLLAAQAATLDNIFTEMARRMAVNMGDHLGATEAYARIALKAQANSRATIEALAKLHQPREQTVRHVHVNEGGQAVIAHEFHHHGSMRGGPENGRSAEQAHAQDPSGPALPCPDALGQRVPGARDQGQEAMPNARRQRKRSA